MSKASELAAILCAVEGTPNPNPDDEVVQRLVVEGCATKADVAHQLVVWKKSKQQDKDIAKLWKPRVRKWAAKLELLGTLVDAGLDGEAQWVQELTKEHPNIDSLQQGKWADIQALLHKHNAQADARDRVRELYVERNALRQQLVKAHIALEAANEVEAKGITDLADLRDKGALDQVSNELDRALGLEQRVLWHKANAVQPEFLKQQKQKHSEAREGADQALELLAKARRELNMNGNATQRAQGLIQEAKAALKLPDDWNEDKRDNPAQTLQDLERLALDLRAPPEVGSFERLVGQASGGAVRKCVVLDDIAKPPAECLIKAPRLVEFVGKGQDLEKEEKRSYDEESASTFHAALKHSGWSIALGLSAQAGGASGSGNVQHDRQHQQGKSHKEAASSLAVQNFSHLVVRKATFKVHLQDMELTAAAERDLDEMDTMLAAAEFLDRYGTHMPVGEQTLGGVLVFKWEESDSESKSKNSKQEHASASTSVGIDIKTVGAGGSAKAGRSRVEAGQDDNASQRKTKRARLGCTAIGPHRLDEQGFLQLLESNAETWAVIDRGDGRSLKPVWEIVGEREWTRQAWMLQLAFAKRNAGQGVLAGPNSNGNQQGGGEEDDVDLVAEVDKVLEGVVVDSDHAYEVEHALYRVNGEILKHQQKFPTKWVLLVVLNKSNLFRDFIKSIATQQLSSAAVLACQMISNEDERRLIEAGVDINVTKLRAVARPKPHGNESEPRGAVAHEDEVVVKLHELAKTLRDLGTTKTDEATRKAGKAVESALLSCNVAERSQLLSIAKRMQYFERTGFAFPIDPSQLARYVEEMLNHRDSMKVGVKVERVLETASAVLPRNLEAWVSGGKLTLQGTISGVRDCVATVHWTTVGGGGGGLSGFLSFLQAPLSWWKGSSSGTRLMPREDGVYAVQEEGQSDVVLPVDFTNPVPVWSLHLDHSQGTPRRVEFEDVVRVTSKGRLGPEALIRDQRTAQRAGPQEELIFRLVRRMRLGGKPADIGSGGGVEPDQPGRGQGGRGGRGRGGRGGGRSNGGRPNDSNPLAILIVLINDCGLGAKIEVAQKLLSQHLSVPLFAQPPGGQLLSHFESLRFALPDAAVDGAGWTEPLLTNTTMPRIAFVSPQAVGALAKIGAVAEALFDCKLLGHLLWHDAVGTFVEMAVGKINEKPWIVVHVRGQYNDKRVWDFLTAYAFTMVVELDFGISNLHVAKTFPHCSFQVPAHAHRMVLWEDAREEPTFASDDPDFFYCVKGDHSSLAGFLRDQILLDPEYERKLQEFVERQPPLQALQAHEVEAGTAADHVEGLDQLVEAVAKVDHAALKTELCLQTHFQAELTNRAKYVQSLSGGGQPAVERDLEADGARKERLKRANVARSVDHPLMRVFEGVLQHQDSEARRLGLKVLAQEIARHAAKAENAQEMHVGVEALWREASLIQVAWPKQNWAKHAARCLQDGMVLELMDGEAEACNTDWIRVVLGELSASLKLLPTFRDRDPRVFVLSVSGVQSSGKSTLLNTMFGCHMHVSPGKCTRGINVQLIPSDRDDLDFVVVMDTEGLRSPESPWFTGGKVPVVHDNRLATLCVLPAHACLIVVQGENDLHMRDVLSVVMVAFNRTKLVGNKALPVLLFAHTRVGNHATNKLRANRESLEVELRACAKDVLEGGDPSELLGDFDRDQDIKYLGFLDNGSRRPNFEFGEQVCALRDHVHQRCVGRRAEASHWTSLGRWIGLVEDVQASLGDVSFELSFIALQLLRVFEEVAKKTRELERKVAEAFSTVADRFETKCVEAKVRGDVLPEIGDGDLEPGTTAVSDAKSELEEFLAPQQFVLHRKSAQHSFDRFCERALETCRRKARSVRTACEVDKRVEEEGAELTKEMREWVRGVHGNPDPESDLAKAKFEELWNKACRRVRTDAAASEVNVEQEVVSVYSSHLQLALARYDDQDAPKVGDPSCERLMVELARLVDKELADVTSFRSDAVMGAIGLTNKALRDGRVRDNATQSKVHTVVRHQVVQALTKKQRAWEKVHHLPTAFEARREEMLVRFRLFCEGLQGAELVKAELRGTIGRAINGAWQSHRVETLANQISKEAFVVRKDVMDAKMDLTILDLLEGGDTAKGFGYLQDPVSCFEDVFRREVVEAVGRMTAPHQQGRAWDTFRGAVRNCLGSVLGEMARLADDVATFESKLTAAFRDNCPHVFKRWTPTFADKSLTLGRDEWKSIKADMEQWLDGFEEPVVDKDALASAVHDEVRERSVRDGLARCDAKCSCCAALCTMRKGHGGKHAARHQPGGIAGFSKPHKWAGIGSGGELVLVKRTCWERLAKRDHVGEGVSAIPFAEWDKDHPHFNNFSRPVQGEERELGKFVFARFQRELAEFHGKGSRTIPDAFKGIDGRSLREELQRQAEGNGRV